MSKLRWFNAAPIVLACWGMLVPTAEIRAEEAAKTTITDIALGDGGVARGIVVDGQGKPVDGASVSIKTDSKVVATAVTDDKGEFSVREIRGGVHEVHAPQGAAVFRFWTAKAAPPAAKNRATIVSDAKAVRGQCGEGGCGLHGDSTPLVTGGGYWSNGAGSALGNSIGNGFGHGGGLFGGCSDGGVFNGGCGDGGMYGGNYCPPEGGSMFGAGLFGGSYLHTAAFVAGTVAIGAVIAEAIDDDDDPVSP